MYFIAARYILSFLFGNVTLFSLLKKHFGKSPERFPIVEAKFPRYRHPCLELALSQYMKQPGVTVKVIGTATDSDYPNLTNLLHPDSRNRQLEGPVRARDMVLSNKKTMSYASHGLYLIKSPLGKLAAWINPLGDFDGEVVLEVLSKERKAGRKFVAEIRRLADEQSVYRGKALSLKSHKDYGVQAVFKDTRLVKKEQLILPEQVLQEIDRHTSSFSKHCARLKESGMHLKRGLLLYGPPGGGKTSTMLYILSSMPERTTIYVGSRNSKMLDMACELARELQPATVIIDDVDLIAGERSSVGNNNETLAELLNQMDGIADDSDVLFLLSTNRPEALEPALAARPGRIDQAICIPLPDADCRRRLFKLYGQTMNITLENPQRLVDMTDGVSGAFIKELFRKALLLAAEESDSTNVNDEVLERAFTTIRSGSPMMEKLLAYKVATPLTIAV